MRIVFYSTTSNKFDGRYFNSTYLPRRADEWDKLAEHYPEHEIILVVSLPGMYLLDMNGNDILRKSDKIRYVFTDGNSSAQEIADIILDLAPAVAVAISSPTAPIDWNSVKDSIIAELLSKNGVKTVANKMYTSIGAFDKWRAHMMLREMGYDIAKAVYIHNDLFWAEAANPSINVNVYKEYVLHRVQGMMFPVIIKDTVGAGSIGLQVVDNFEHAREMLTAESNKADLIVEEFLQGEQFGTEVHGAKGNYHVLPPFRFSTTDAGITDPFQSVKFGPITDKKYRVEQLRESLRRLAETLDFAGSVQIDLVFYNNKWYVIEINPRWSGMTTTCAAAEGRSAFDIFMESAVPDKTNFQKWENLKYAMNFKMSGLTDEDLERLYAMPNVKYVMNSVSSSSGRRFQYCEIILGGVDKAEELLDSLKAIDKAFPGVMSPLVTENAQKMIC